METMCHNVKWEEGGGSQVSVDDIGMFAMLEHSTNFILEPGTRQLKISFLLLGMTVKQAQKHQRCADGVLWKWILSDLILPDVKHIRQEADLPRREMVARGAHSEVHWAGACLDP